MPEGTGWLLRKNPENLEEAENTAERLKGAREFDAPLAAAY